jgi:hypothetical protein
MEGTFLGQKFFTSAGVVACTTLKKANISWFLFTYMFRLTFYNKKCMKKIHCVLCIDIKISSPS